MRHEYATLALICEKKEYVVKPSGIPPAAVAHEDVPRLTVSLSFCRASTIDANALVPHGSDLVDMCRKRMRTASAEHLKAAREGRGERLSPAEVRRLRRISADSEVIQDTKIALRLGRLRDRWLFEDCYLAKFVELSRCLSVSIPEAVELDVLARLSSDLLVNHRALETMRRRPSSAIDLFAFTIFCGAALPLAGAASLPRDLGSELWSAIDDQIDFDELVEANHAWMSPSALVRWPNRAVDFANEP